MAGCCENTGSENQKGMIYGKMILSYGTFYGLPVKVLTFSFVKFFVQDN
jgi:hypothetical protein